MFTNLILRNARPADAEAFIAIKQQLPMMLNGAGTLSGGFLLGTDVQTYRYYIEQANCLVAQSEEAVVGFGIVFPDHLVKASELWQKREQASWHIPIEDYTHQPVCYFEQLAFIPGYRKWAFALAYQLVNFAFSAGCRVLFTTTVKKPVTNLAAIPFIKAAGGIHAGNIDEYYPGVGAINSDIYLIESESFTTYTRKSGISDFLKAVRVCEE